MSNNVLIIAEQRDNNLKTVSLEILTVATDIAGKLGGAAEAVVLGDGVSPLAESLSHCGASKVYVADSPALAAFSPDGYASVIAELVQRTEPAVVLTSATAWGKDLAPRVAAKLGTGLASDCIGFEVDDEGLLITRPIFAGKAIAKVRVKSSPQMATVRPNTFPPAEADTTRAVNVETLPVDSYRGGAVVTEFATTGGEKLDVAEADIIVSGGRGMSGPENYVILEELAGLLGGAVGASRAAVDAGWRPHSDQVGQTGKTVSPTLYIACGISGAVQHLAGMRTSKCIVAVNKDPEAPIFSVADYGIVADLFKVVPVLTEEFKKVMAG